MIGPEDLQKIYQRRFAENIDFRIKMYQVLCEKIFQKYIPEDATVLEVAAGYCEFINNIQASKKIAVDLNPDIKKYAGPSVEVIESTSTNMTQVKDSTIDAVFVSNFFEHLSREDISKTVQEIHRILKPEGKALILQPNYRYCYRDYWMFFDHITPLDDRSLSEVLEINGLEVIENRPRFLPYTMKSRLPKSIFLVKLYLKIPLAQWLLGKQAFLVARKMGK